MKRIALIMATPPSVNPGMLACEATARSFLKQADLLGQTTFFRIQSLEERTRLTHLDPRLKEIITQCDLSMSFEILQNISQLNDYIPIFWGDFLHMHRYMQAIQPSWSTSIADIRQLLLLEGAPSSLLRRTISYASSFLFNSTADYHDPSYGSALQNFIRTLHHVQMRDAISAAVVAGIRLSNENFFGLDAAQLLSIEAYSEDIIGLITTTPQASQRRRALLFFARGKHKRDSSQSFVKDLLMSMDMNPEWLEWGDRFSFPFRDTAWIDLSRVQLKASPGISHLKNLLTAICNSSAVITDTYHLCVISWALGVPAIMLPGDYHDKELTSKGVNVRSRHDKRKILMGQDGLLDFYIEPYLLESGQQSDIVNRLSRIVLDPGFAQNFRKRLASRAKTSEGNLLHAIRSVRSVV